MNTNNGNTEKRQAKCAFLLSQKQVKSDYAEKTNMRELAVMKKRWSTLSTFSGSALQHNIMQSTL